MSCLPRSRTAHAHCEHDGRVHSGGGGGERAADVHLDHSLPPPAAAALVTQEGEVHRPHNKEVLTSLRRLHQRIHSEPAIHTQLAARGR